MKQQLHDQHRKLIRDRYGLTNKTIAAARLWSSTGGTDLLNWNGGGCPSGIVIPYEMNGYARVRRDHATGPRRYESPKGEPSQVYFPPGPAQYHSKGIRGALAVPLSLGNGREFSWPPRRLTSERFEGYVFDGAALVPLQPGAKD